MNTDIHRGANDGAAEDDFDSIGGLAVEGERVKLRVRRVTHTGRTAEIEIVLPIGKLVDIVDFAREQSETTVRRALPALAGNAA